MKENIKFNSNIEKERQLVLPESFRDCSFFTIRHADARYRKNEAIVAGQNPESEFVPYEQDFDSDLSPEGKEKAKEKAESFLAQFEPSRDVLYFASSNLVRARETAAIFLETAKSRGFQIIQATINPSHKIDSEIQSKLGGNDIRTFESLSLDIHNMLVEFVFHPHNYLNPRKGEETHVFYPEKISPATKELWEAARKIIESDNKGTWGKNFLAHGEEIKKMFSGYAIQHSDEKVPSITSAEDMYNTRFRGMLREMKTAKDKISEYERIHSKRIRVLAFSHENSFLHFLDKEFGQQGIDKLEAVGYDVIYDSIGHEHYVAAIEDAKHNTNIKEITLPKLSTK